MFTQIRSFHEDSAGLPNAISAITSVARQPDGQIITSLFLLNGAWFGGGLADRASRWRVSVVPITSQDLTDRMLSSSKESRLKIGDTEATLIGLSKPHGKEANDIKVTVSKKDDIWRADVTYPSTSTQVATFTRANSSKVRVSGPVSVHFARNRLIVWSRIDQGERSRLNPLVLCIDLIIIN